MFVCACLAGAAVDKDRCPRPRLRRQVTPHFDQGGWAQMRLKLWTDRGLVHHEAAEEKEPFRLSHSVRGTSDSGRMDRCASILRVSPIGLWADCVCMRFLIAMMKVAARSPCASVVRHICLNMRIVSTVSVRYLPICAPLH